MALGPCREQKYSQATSEFPSELGNSLSFLGPGLCSSNVSQRKNICPQQPGPISDFPEIITCGRNIPTCGPHQCRLWWGDRRWEVEKLDCPPAS